MIVKPLFKEIGFPVRTVDATGKPVELTAELLKKAIQNTKYLRTLNFHVNCYDGHFKYENKDIKGEWTDVTWIDDKAYGVVIPRDQEAREYIKKHDTSMVIEFDVNINGEVIDMAITRIDIVGQGAIVGTGNFQEPEDFQFKNYLNSVSQAFGRTPGAVYFCYSNNKGKQSMLLQLMAKALGLPAESTEDAVLAAMYDKMSIDATQEEDERVMKMSQFFEREPHPAKPDPEKALPEKKPEPIAAMKSEHTEKTEMSREDSFNKVGTEANSKSVAMGRQMLPILLSRLPQKQRAKLQQSYDELCQGGLSPELAIKNIGDRVQEIEGLETREKQAVQLSQFSPAGLAIQERPDKPATAETKNDEDTDKAIAIWQHVYESEHGTDRIDSLN
jgi:antitoxin component HigA of HigAB toxin-antitoxin module